MTGNTEESVDAGLKKIHALPFLWCNTLQERIWGRGASLPGSRALLPAMYRIGTAWRDLLRESRQYFWLLLKAGEASAKAILGVFLLPSCHENVNRSSLVRDLIFARQPIALRQVGSLEFQLGIV